MPDGEPIVILQDGKLIETVLMLAAVSFGTEGLLAWSGAGFRRCASAGQAAPE